MELSNTQRADLHSALLTAFPSLDELRMLVDFELGEQLEAIAGGTDLSVWTYHLLAWAIRTGRIEALVRGALRRNPGNPELNAWCAECCPGVLQEVQAAATATQAAPKSTATQAAPKSTATQAAPKSTALPAPSPGSTALAARLVRQAQQREWARHSITTVPGYRQANRQRFHTYLGDLNPFPHEEAMLEDFSVWCDLEAFWPHHPANRLIEASAGSVVIAGEAGSGKSALARADHARMVQDTLHPEGLWVRVRDKPDARRLQSAVADRLLEFMISNPSFWHSLDKPEQETLARLWLRSFDRSHVLMRAKVTEQKAEPLAADQRSIEAAMRAAEEAPDSPDRRRPWYQVASDVARSIGFHRVRLFVDDPAQPADTYRLKDLLALGDGSIEVVVLTSRPAVAETYVAAGFRKGELVWSKLFIWQMVLHRLVRFSREACSSAGGVDLFPDLLHPVPRLEEWTEYPLIKHLFSPEGWETAAAMAELDTPRKMFRLWQALLARPSSPHVSEHLGPEDVALARKAILS